MRILGFSNDWRFSHKLPVPPCLNWLEGLTFKYNRKHQKAAEGKGPLCIFTSNDMEKGWNSTDVEAFRARMACVITCFATLEMAGAKENNGNQRLEKCQKCGACSLLLKSSPLQKIVQKQDPVAFYKFDAHIKSYYAAMMPLSNHYGRPSAHTSNEFLSEYDALVAEAENR